MMNDENLIQEFVSEGREHLAGIEPDFLVLEREGEATDPEVVNRIFRAIHSIKGASGFFGFEAIKRLSHSMENVLMMVRDGKLKPSTGLVSPLLTGTDRLSLMLDDIQASEQVPFADVVETLEAIMNPGAAPVAPQAETPLQATTPTPSAHIVAACAPEPEEIEASARMGQVIYALKLRWNEELVEKNRDPLQVLQLAESLGRVVRCSFSLEQPPTLEDAMDPELPLVILLSSVLEEDLLAIALDMEQSQIEAFLDAKPAPVAEAIELESSTPTGTQPPGAALSESDSEPQTHPETMATPVIEGAIAAENPAPAPDADSKKAKAVASESVETIRVRVDLLNNLMNLAGELVLLRNQLLRTLKDDAGQPDGLGTVLQNLNLTTSNLQEHIMQTRMQPIGSVFSRFRRVVRDMAHQLDKKIDLEIIGEEVELDKSLLESLSDPLTHIVRNSCDHGLETAEERLVAGKPETGRLLLHAYHEGGQINILIEDDGRGIDPAKVARKAIQSGLVTAAQVDRMSQKDIINFIMLPGFSTAENVSDLSGRGVGMDVVRTNIEKMGGNITIESRLGHGTRMLLKLPLTLAIIPSLIVAVKDYRFAIPQLNLVELICVRSDEVSRRVEKIGAADVLRLRGRLLPLLRLADALEIERDYTDPETGEALSERRTAIADRRTEDWGSLDAVGSRKGGFRRQDGLQNIYIVILSLGANQYGLIVDHVLNLEEIVVKPLPNYLKSCRSFSGATIMGDGKVAMILDVVGLSQSVQLAFTETDTEAHRRETAAIKPDCDMEQHDIVLFNFAENEVFAVPLSGILRIEKCRMENIQQVGQQEYLPYHGKGLPLVRLNNLFPVSPLPHHLEEGYLIIPNTPGYEFGIIASCILDAVQVEAKLQPIFDGQQPGLSGAAVIQNRMTMFVDPDALAHRTGLRATSLPQTQNPMATEQIPDSMQDPICDLTPEPCVQ
ncbi:MAG TPA: chemotaxis protein CheA [Coleofasciculaceae cyanobacterium]|jgi:two-component system chemotaxis sensor kinase CheA